MAAATMVFLPWCASGHFMSTIEAAKRMLDASGGGLSLTVLVMQAPMPAKAAEVEDHVRRESSSSSSSSSGLDIRFLNLPAVERPTDRVDPEEFIFRYIQLHAPQVEEAIAGLPSPVAAIVFDFFCTPLLDVAADLAVPRYVYFASTGAFLALLLRLQLPGIRKDLLVRLKQAEGAVDVPGLPPVPVSCMPKCLLSSKTRNHEWFEHCGRRLMDASGIIINSSVELEPGVLAAIADGRCVPGRPAPPVHAIGPVIWLASAAAAAAPEQQPHACLQWLDTQPPASVVFLCFGSNGVLNIAQVREVAAGLERSGHRFLWVLRGAPAAGSPHPTDGDLDAVLPAGFLARTRGRGLVWPAWAPQKEILAHPAVGGFVSHCGWNSSLESLWFGVPMLPWPLYAEQHLNAFELVGDMGVAVHLKDMDVAKAADLLVEAAELEAAVRGLMGGTEAGRKAREKAAAMKDACRNAVVEGGSSYAALRQLMRGLCPGGGAPSS